MIGAIFEVDDAKAVAALNGYVIAAKNPGPGLRQVGAAVKSRVKLGFRNSQAPDGTPWAGITHRTGKPLLDTGRLRNSITSQLIGKTAVAVGTNVVYARAQQEGLNGITARPFIPETLPAAWAKETLATLQDFLQRAGRG